MRTAGTPREIDAGRDDIMTFDYSSDPNKGDEDIYLVVITENPLRL
jgi:hypothetical protein